MKSSYFHCLVLPLALLLTHANAQKEMIVNDALLKKSEPMLAKAKGIGTVTKYQFANYRIVSGKEGWTTTKQRSRWFGFENDFASQRKL